MPGLTRHPGEGRPRIVQQPLASGLRPMLTMVIRPWLVDGCVCVLIRNGGVATLNPQCAEGMHSANRPIQLGHRRSSAQNLRRGLKAHWNHQ